jgi:papilin
VEGGSYIVGEPNATVVGVIGQPATIRCAAGGYPKPFVTWWRGDKILPLKDDRFEITRDYSLVFSRLELFDLGPYVCQAYNSVSRPVSISVTLKARGSLRPRNEEEAKYTQYMVSEPAPTERPIYRPPPPTQTTRRPPPNTRAPLPPTPPQDPYDTNNGEWN